VSEPEVGARVAAAIVAGMKAVMLVDGHADPRELAVIAARQAELPEGIDVSGARVTDPRVLRLLVRSLLEVALADGVIVEAERDVIRELTRAHGGDEALIAEVEAELRAG
jgi:uncharacterized membrane protein YebE (DUF533 family)